MPGGGIPRGAGSVVDQSRHRIDCDACVPECPVEAIYPEDNVPDDQQEWIDLNKDAENHPTLAASKDPLKGPKCGNPNAA